MAQAFNRQAFASSPFLAALQGAAALTLAEVRDAKREGLEDRRVRRHLCKLQALAAWHQAQAAQTLDVIHDFAAALEGSPCSTSIDSRLAATRLMRAVQAWADCDLVTLDQVRTFRNAVKTWGASCRCALGEWKAAREGWLKIADDAEARVHAERGTVQ